MTINPATRDPLAAPDAQAGNWVDRHAPAGAKPYLRLMRADRPVGTWLVFAPCLWGASLALTQIGGGWAENAWRAVLYAIGAFVMRGAGCAYNDIVDRDIDAQVERTAVRPLPSGQISLKAAWTFLFALCGVGFLVLIQLNAAAILLGLGSLLLVAAYPFMKRITWWPQAWLGLTLNWGALVGYAAATGGLSPSPLLLYAGGICWTLAYDTIYAHQDIEDDALIGVKSAARRLGSRTEPALAGFYVGVIVFFALAGALAGLSAVFFVALAAPAGHFAWQMKTFQLGDRQRALMVFKSNRDAGLLLLAPLLLEAIATTTHIVP